MTATPPIEVRDMEFALENVPRFWHGERRAVTTFFDALSTFLPPGERFFIASVKANARFVEEGELRDEVRAFYGQEGYHSREHIRFNEMVERHGYPSKALEQNIATLLEQVRRIAPVRHQLAITCALEHLTALMAEVLLHNPDAMEGAHPEVAALWRWHAAEETEHKGVAYDVFLAAGGGRIQRSRAMIAATLYFLVLLFYHQLVFMRLDGTQRSAREWLDLGRFLLRAARGTNVVRRYFEYFRRDFHPWDHDNLDLLENWKNAQVGSAPVPALSGNVYLPRSERLAND